MNYNTLEKEDDEMKKKYPWLEPGDERRNISEREILVRYGDLDKSCLIDSKKKQVMGMLHKYKDAFSLRDEIGICPNLEIKIYVADKSPFFDRLYHIKEEDKIL